MLLPDLESQRLEALYQYQILDTPPEEVFDDLVNLTAEIYNTPIALISLLDSQREWLKAKVGMNESEIPRSICFGHHTIYENDILIIPDTWQDERFIENPLVKLQPYYRFYAGVPLINADGLALGCLSVIDFIPRTFSTKEQDSLKRLARQVVRQLELYRQQNSIERSLQKSETRFRTILESIPVPLIISRVDDGLILYTNSDFLRTFQISATDLVNCNVVDFYQNSADKQQVLASLSQHGSLQNYDIQFKRRDGSSFWAIASIQYLNFNNEFAILTVLYDITERKNAEARLQEQNALLQGIFTGMPLMIALISPEGQVQWINQELERLLGWSLRDYQTLDIFTQLYPQPEDRLLVMNFMQDGEGVWKDFKTHTRQGRILDTSWTNIKLATGQIISIGQEITSRKQTERALKGQLEREQLMRAVAQRIRQSLNLQDILDATVTEIKDLLRVDRVLVYQFAPDMSGTIVAESVESGWRVALGAEIEDTCFQEGHGTEYRQGRKKAIANVYTVGLTDCHLQLLEQFQVKANLIVPILLEVSEGNTVPQLWGLLVAHQCSAPREWEDHELELLDQLSVPIAIAIQQSSILQQAKNELAERQKAEVKLRSALAEKDVLLKEVHHRVKNNLQIVSGLLLLHAQTLKDPELIKTLRESQNRVESISLIHKNLYTSPNIGQLDVAEYINNLASSILMSYQIEPGKIGLETNISQITLNVDQAIACGLIINELLTNSLKHAFPQQRGEIKIDLQQVGKNIEMTIQDNGVGLPDNLDWRYTDSLGLSLVYDLVTEQLEGSVSVASQPGTTFKIQFPH
jgi:PAS domain S-box-containing protein